jgi:hypothetical protein
MAKAFLVLLLIAGAAFFIYRQTNRTESSPAPPAGPA